jgi:hypothetical protein
VFFYCGTLCDAAIQSLLGLSSVQAFDDSLLATLGARGLVANTHPAAAVCSRTRAYRLLQSARRNLPASDVSHSGTRRAASGDLSEWSVRIAGAALAARALESVVRETARLEAELVATLSSELDVVTFHDRPDSGGCQVVP